MNPSGQPSGEDIQRYLLLPGALHAVGYRNLSAKTKTILDAAEAGTAPDQVELAMVQGIERGLAAPDELRRDAAARGRRVAALIEGALRGVAA